MDKLHVLSPSLPLARDSVRRTGGSEESLFFGTGLHRAVLLLNTAHLPNVSVTR